MSNQSRIVTAVVAVVLVLVCVIGTMAYLRGRDDAATAAVVSSVAAAEAWRRRGELYARLDAAVGRGSAAAEEIERSRVDSASVVSDNRVEISQLDGKTKASRVDDIT
jgi:hypothetical protein